MKKKYGENHLRKEEKESSEKGMNKKNRILLIRISIDKEQDKILKEYGVDDNILIERLQNTFNAYINWIEETYKRHWWEG